MIVCGGTVGIADAQDDEDDEPFGQTSATRC